jgi:integrase
MKNAGIVRYLNGAYLDFHSLRHTYITRLATNKDIALPTAQKLARHSTINLTMRYTHVDTEQMYKGLNALPGLGEPTTKPQQKILAD